MPLIVPPPDKPPAGLVVGNLPYLVAVIIMAAFALTAIITILVLRPTADNSSLIATVVSLTVPTTVSLLAFMKSTETHGIVNSRMDEFKRELVAASALASEAARTAGQLEGRREGVAAANARTDQIAVNKENS